MSIHYLEEDRKATGFSKSQAKIWLHEIVRLEGKKPGVISYVFCSDDFLAGVNKQFLNRDYFTDVISFDYSEGGLVSGDIMISVDRVRENAEALGISYTDEIKRIMIHGLLHLIGYDDSTHESKVIMSGMEDLYLGMAGEAIK